MTTQPATDDLEVLLAAVEQDAATWPPPDDDTPTPSGPGPRRSRRYVFVVEDDNDIRRTVRDILETEGYFVQEAASGVEALKILDEEYTRASYVDRALASYLDEHAPYVPDCILLDYMLPPVNGEECSGFDFYRFLRQRPPFVYVPVIIMSADVRIREFQHRALNVDGLDVPPGTLPKPFSVEQLLIKVDLACRSSRHVG